MSVRPLPTLRFKDKDTQRAYDAIRQAMGEGNRDRGRTPKTQSPNTWATEKQVTEVANKQGQLSNDIDQLGRRFGRRKFRLINDGGTHTLGLEDELTIVSSTSPVNVYLPLVASAYKYPFTRVYTVVQRNTGNLRLYAQGGENINGDEYKAIPARYGSFTVVAVGDQTWVLL